MKMPRILPLIAIAVGGIVAVRAVGLAPDLFQGAQAWAQEGVVAAEDVALPTIASAPAVCALSEEQLAEQAGISPAELRIIQSLSARRDQLDARDTDFATMLPLMAAAEQKLDERIAALNAVKAELEGMLGQADEREQAEVNRLVQVYQASPPRSPRARLRPTNPPLNRPEHRLVAPRRRVSRRAPRPRRRPRPADRSPTRPAKRRRPAPSPRVRRCSKTGWRGREQRLSPALVPNEAMSRHVRHASRPSVRQSDQPAP